MAEIVALFFGVIGPDLVPPTNIQELIPYLITIFIGVALVSGVFKVIAGLARSVIELRRL